jgi:2-methylcitrate dehydratase PrpD
MGPQPSETAAQRLAAFGVGLDGSGIPDAVRAGGARHLLDTLGCGLAAVGLGVGGAGRAVALDEGGTPQASILGTERRVTAAAAALANGALCHALDFDDTHERGICHVSTVVGPAAWAVAEARGATGHELVTAYLVGCEVALRIAVAGADGFYARGFHPTSVAGVFGAATAAARLSGLSAAQATNALGIAGSFASGLLEYLSDGSATKPLHAGWAAQAGVRAAALAQMEGEGPASVVEGRFGVLASFGDGHGDRDAIVADLGGHWEVAQTAVKLYPACHFGHAPTWAAARLVDEHGLRLDEIEEIEVSVPPEGVALVLEPLADKHAPRTPYEAKFSLPFTVAHLLGHGELGLAAFDPAVIRDETVLALARRVRPEPWRGEVPSRFAGAATVRTARGALALQVDHPPGSPGNPADDEALLAKFRANARLALDDVAVDELAAGVLALDEALDPGAVLGPARAARLGGR